MKQTAMSRFIEYLEDIKERDNIPSWVINTAKNCLAIEKQQIYDANERGFVVGRKDIGETAVDYYEKTFKNL